MDHQYQKHVALVCSRHGVEYTQKLRTITTTTKSRIVVSVGWFCHFGFHIAREDCKIDPNNATLSIEVSQYRYYNAVVTYGAICNILVVQGTVVLGVL